MSANISFSKIYFYARSLVDSSYELTTRMCGTQLVLEYYSSREKITIILVNGKFVEIDIQTNLEMYIRCTAELTDKNNVICMLAHKDMQNGVVRVINTHPTSSLKLLKEILS
jgi:hypothetical protein